nr:MAG: hypothetical protein [Microvirus sp.]
MRGRRRGRGSSQGAALLLQLRRHHFDGGFFHEEKITWPLKSLKFRQPLAENCGVRNTLSRSSPVLGKSSRLCSRRCCREKR